MICIVSAFTENKSEIWDNLFLKDARDRLLASILKKSLFEQVFLLTNSPDAISYPERANMHCIVMQPPSANAAGIRKALPQTLVEQVIKHCSLLDDTLFFNCNHLLADPSLLDRAITKYSKISAPVLVSIVNTEDHPCQQFAYHRFLDAGVCVPVMQSANHTRLSEAFSFKWISVGVSNAQPGDIFQMKVDRWGVVACPVAENGYLGRQWIYDSPESAKAVVPTGIPKHSGTLAFDPAKPHGRNIYLLSDGTGGFCFKIPGISGGVTPRGAFFSVLNQDGNPVSTVFVKEKSTLEEFRFRMDGVETNGNKFLYAVVSQWENKKNPFFYQQYGFNKFWEVNRDGVLINLQTESEIRGRQNFPDVYEITDVVTVVKGELLQTIACGNYDDLDNIYGMPLNGQEAVGISSPFDVLRYKAQVRAMMNEGIDEEFL